MGVTFTSAAAKRIAAAVRKVERTPQDRTRDRTPPGPDEQSFDAWLNGCDLSGKRYSWVRVYPDMSSDDPDLLLDTGLKWKIFGDSPVTGYQTAFESNGVRGVTDRIVRLRFAGFNVNGDPCYTFNHEAEQPGDSFLPIHDHRDNVTGGGFAFSVYHPGTSLPQQPWAI